jgi:hypothetical protein
MIIHPDLFFILSCMPSFLYYLNMKSTHIVNIVETMYKSHFFSTQSISFCILQFSVVFLSKTDNKVAVLTIVCAVEPVRLKEAA